MHINCPHCQNPIEIVQVIQDEPRPPRRINDKIPRDLETICLKAMSKPPARRYASARELADDLRRWLAGEPIAARPVGSAETAWENARVARVLHLLKQHEPQPGEEDLRGFEWPYWNRLAHSYQMSLKGHTGGVINVAFSADGKRLASPSEDQTVRVWDATSGQEALTLKGHTGFVYSVVYSADAKRLASASEDQTVKVWDARPWTPQLRAEQQALSLVRFYSAPPISKDELLARIRADATVSEAVRERALQFARQWPEGK